MYPDDDYEPSGKALPHILRRAARKGRGSGSDEIEAQLEATVRVWQTLQQQIQRGEDHYVEESGSFNIYKGWDGFIDARLFETMPKRFDHRWFSSSVSHTLSHQPWPPVPPLAEVQTVSVQSSVLVSSAATEQQPIVVVAAAAVVDAQEQPATTDQDDDVPNTTAPPTKRKRVR